MFLLLCVGVINVFYKQLRIEIIRFSSIFYLFILVLWEISLLSSVNVNVNAVVNYNYNVHICTIYIKVCIYIYIFIYRFSFYLYISFTQKKNRFNEQQLLRKIIIIINNNSIYINKIILQIIQKRRRVKIIVNCLHIHIHRYSFIYIFTAQLVSYVRYGLYICFCWDCWVRIRLFCLGQDRGTPSPSPGHLKHLLKYTVNNLP